VGKLQLRALILARLDDYQRDIVEDPKWHSWYSSNTNTEMTRSTYASAVWKSFGMEFRIMIHLEYRTMLIPFSQVRLRRKGPEARYSRSQANIRN